MKIVIANGMHAADYVIGIYKNHKKHQIILINDNSIGDFFLPLRKIDPT